METEVIYDDGLAYSPNSAQEFIWHIEVNMALSSSREAGQNNGLDGFGHIGYAAQIGLNPFGRDVFNNPAGQ